VEEWKKRHRLTGIHRDYPRDHVLCHQRTDHKTAYKFFLICSLVVVFDVVDLLFSIHGK
jgi:hypothetical protein